MILSQLSGLLYWFLERRRAKSISLHMFDEKGQK